MPAQGGCRRSLVSAARHDSASIGFCCPRLHFTQVVYMPSVAPMALVMKRQCPAAAASVLLPLALVIGSAASECCRQGGSQHPGQCEEQQCAGLPGATIGSSAASDAELKAGLHRRQCPPRTGGLPLSVAFLHVPKTAGGQGARGVCGSICTRFLGTGRPLCRGRCVLVLRFRVGALPPSTCAQAPSWRG